MVNLTVYVTIHPVLAAVGPVEASRRVILPRAAGMAGKTQHFRSQPGVELALLEARRARRTRCLGILALPAATAAAGMQRPRGQVAPVQMVPAAAAAALPRMEQTQAQGELVPMVLPSSFASELLGVRN
jgi:hypothetical protein